MIPVFLKRAKDEWEYVGRYRCERWSQDLTEIQARTPMGLSYPIYRVLFLKPAK